MIGGNLVLLTARGGVSDPPSAHLSRRTTERTAHLGHASLRFGPGFSTLEKMKIGPKSKLDGRWVYILQDGVCERQKKTGNHELVEQR